MVFTLLGGCLWGPVVGGGEGYFLGLREPCAHQPVALGKILRESICSLCGRICHRDTLLSATPPFSGWQKFETLCLNARQPARS